MADLLVLYYSAGGSVRRMAELVAEGIERAPGAAARLRTVPGMSSHEKSVPSAGPPYCELGDLEECAGLALGSPTRFGNMAAPLKAFWDGTGLLWQRGTLAELNATRTGGTPYGASHFAGMGDDQPISDAERALCVAQGKRLAEIALQLAK